MKHDYTELELRRMERDGTVPEGMVIFRGGDSWRPLIEEEQQEWRAGNGIPEPLPPQPKTKPKMRLVKGSANYHRHEQNS